MGAERFDLVETMAFDPQGGIAELDRHLDRLRASAAALDLPFNRHEARNELQAATFRAGPSLVRLLLSPTGAMAIELRPLPPAPHQPVAVAVVPRPLDPDDVALRHDIGEREAVRAARDRAGTFEILFRDADGFLTEGSFTSLFVERDGVLLTPPAARGLRGDVLRTRLLETGDAAEAELVEADLAGGFLVGNAVRGLIRAIPVSPNSARAA